VKLAMQSIWYYVVILLLCVPVSVPATQNRDFKGTKGPAAKLSVILGRPTDRSIFLSILSIAEAEIRVEYGHLSGHYTEKTDTRISQAQVPVEFELGSLKPDTKYYYRIFMRVSDTSDLQPQPEGTFHTQRSPGSTFTFALQGDSHPERQGKMFDPNLYARTMLNVAQDPPDFYITLGDDFSIENLINRRTLSSTAVDQMYILQRSFLGVIGRSSAIFLVNGNHEQAALCNLDGTPVNAAVLAGGARTRYFPLPDPDAFYGGNAEEIEYVGLPRDYYSWTWGDALFVVIDPYWHSSEPVDNEAGGRRSTGTSMNAEGKNRDLWKVTLGDTQYQWLRRILTESKSRWKFVFCHHVMGTGRGGTEMAGLYEWGGRNKSGRWEFDRKRPGWELPIHQLMVKTGVTILFQGHDHLYARQELDGIIYQSCPNPADPTYQAFNSDAYRADKILPNSGHLRLTVTPDIVRVEYIRSFLPADENNGRVNGTVADRLTIPFEAQRTSR
jgi:hypothetical protein